MKSRFASFGKVSLLLLLWAASASGQVPFTVSGNIASGAQYDLHVVTLQPGNYVATLVCDFDGVSRPLDPVLSVFFPGNPNTHDTIFSDAYNDDGFGTDDDPNGIDCDAFDSSRIFLLASTPGAYTFRADGFGSSTGPYTLTVDTLGSPLAIPTLDEVGLAGLALALAAISLYVLRRRRAA